MTHTTPSNAARKPTILDGPVVTAESLVEAISRCAGSDWRASAWVLEHDPRFRPDFSDAGHERTAERRVVRVVLDAIEASGLPPDLLRIVLLNLQAKGLSLVTPGAALDD